jgi:threonine/homoserine/homoserine lactone efflux protein
VADVAGFVALAVVIIVTPGPDTALTIRNTLIGGRPAGIATAVGVALGQTTWSIATSAGVSALIAAAEPAFIALKLAGAAYLIFLGAQSLWSALRRETERSHPIAERRPRGSALRQGVISNLTNPKMAVFFPSLLPQFVSPGAASFAMLLALGLLFCCMTLIWLAGYAFAVARAGDVLRRSRVRRAIEGATGAVLVAFGVRVAASTR